MALETLHPSAAAPQHVLKRWTVGELYRLDEAGLLPPATHVELVEGALFEVSPTGEAHFWILSLLA